MKYALLKLVSFITSSFVYPIKRLNHTIWAHISQLHSSTRPPNDSFKPIQVIFSIAGLFNDNHAWLFYPTLESYTNAFFLFGCAHAHVCVIYLKWVKIKFTISLNNQTTALCSKLWRYKPVIYNTISVSSRQMICMSDYLEQKEDLKW